MTRRRGRRLLVVGVAMLSLLVTSSLDARKPGRRKRPAAKAAAANFDTRLPVLGTKLAEFPPGPAKATADQACLSCHSADMVWQQRLNEKQWTASVVKMVNWGAPVPEAKRAELVEYLVKNFGPDNDRFQPVVTRPVGR